MMDVCEAVSMTQWRLGRKRKLKPKKCFYKNVNPVMGQGPSAARPPPATQAPHTHTGL